MLSYHGRKSQADKGNELSQGELNRLFEDTISKYTFHILYFFAKQPLLVLQIWDTGVGIVVDVSSQNQEYLQNATLEGFPRCKKDKGSHYSDIFLLAMIIMDSETECKFFYCFDVQS